MDRVFRDVTTMGNDAIFLGEGLEKIGEGSDESNGMCVHGESFSQSQDRYQTPIGKGKGQVGKTPIVGEGRIPRGSVSLARPMRQFSRPLLNQLTVSRPPQV